MTKALRVANNIPLADDIVQVKPDNAENLERSLAEAIDTMLDERNGRKWKQSSGFAASMNNACPRYLGYRLRGFEQDVNFSPQTYRIFDEGHKLEDRLNEYLENLGILIERERKIVHAKPPITAYVDFVVDWDGEKPIECKSISQAGFDYRKLYKKPSDSHYRQIQVYLDIGQWEEGFVYYENKNNGEVLPFLVKRDPEFVGKLYAKWNKIYEAHQNGDFSVRPYKEDSKKCLGCDAFNWCWKKDTTVGIKMGR